MLKGNFLHTHQGIRQGNDHKHVVVDELDYKKIHDFLYNNPEVCEMINNGDCLILNTSSLILKGNKESAKILRSKNDNTI